MGAARIDMSHHFVLQADMEETETNSVSAVKTVQVHCIIHATIMWLIFFTGGGRGMGE